MPDFGGVLAQIATVAFASTALRLAAPLILAAAGGLVVQRVGIWNIALEGNMLTGAFAAVAFVTLTKSAGVSLALTLGVAILFSLAFAFLVIELGTNAVVAGLGLNILALALTDYLLPTFLHHPGGFVGTGLPSLGTPLALPFFDHLGSAGALLSPYPVLVYAALVGMVLVALLLSRSGLGLAIRAVGLYEDGAAATGVRVRLVKYSAFAICGIFCGLAGAEISMGGGAPIFSPNMTAGLGYIAFGAVLFGRANPLPVFVGALLFGAASAVPIYVSGPPLSLMAMIPYVITFVALVGFSLYQQLAPIIRLSRRGAAASPLATS